MVGISRSELETRLRTYYELATRSSAHSYRDYLQYLVINSSPEPRRFKEVVEDWQLSISSVLGPALESVAGIRKDYQGPASFWFTLPRGHDKTSGIGRALNWALGFSARHLSMVTAAADKDQAGLIREAMQSEARLNPWLGSRVVHHREIVKGPGGLLRVLAADQSTNWGLNSDIYLLDEITHWKKQELFDVLWSGREKRPGSLFIVISNAGVRGSWQENILDLARIDPSWFVFEAPEGEQLASWMSPDKVARMRRFLPRGLAKRVLDNTWIDAAEESDFLSRVEVEGCERLGKELGLVYRTTGIRGKRYVASIDYGPKRDRTALSVGHKEGNVVVVDRLDVWQGSPDSPVQLSRVEEWIEEVNRSFNHPELVLDPYQMEGIAQKYETRQVVDRFEARGGKRTYQMAENLRSLIASSRLAVYPGAGLLVVEGKREGFVDEVVGLVLKPTPYGYRFDHQAGFHDDRSVSVGMLALHLEQMDPSGPGVAAPQLTTEPIGSKVSAILRGGGSVVKRRGLFGI